MERTADINFKKATYPKENNRFFIAMIVGVPVVLLSVLSTLATFGLMLIFVAFYWFIYKIFKINFIGNSIKVSKNNFPEIFSIYQEVKYELSYKKDIDIYIVEEGTVNAFFANFFRTKFIVLNSGLVIGMNNNNQLKWVIARFIGTLKTKYSKTTLLRLVFEIIEDIKIFNFFILPYERATQYTGDNIGLLVTNNVEDTFNAFNKFMVGNNLSKKINFKGIVAQGITLKNRSFFSFLARSFSSYPHLVDRYLNLLAFSKKEFPQQFDEYLKNYDSKEKQQLNYLLPKY